VVRRSIVVLALVACGGASGPGPKGGGARGANDAEDGPKIGDAAVAQGGLAALGGAGNREAEPPPRAVASTFRADLVERGAPVRVDGVLGEWPARIAAKQVVRGSGEGTAFAAALQYDDAKLYVAGEVTESSFVRTHQFKDEEDHASLVLAFPSGGSFAVYEVGLFAGVPGESAGEVRWLGAGRGEVPGAKIVESPINGGYAFEAQIPWSAFPEARTVRVGLRGVARYYDAQNGQMRTILATGPGDTQTPAGLPWLPTEPEQTVIETLLIPKQLSQTPRAEVICDVAGDAMKERVAVYDRFFTISGPGFRGGKEFFYRDLAAELVKLEARDLLGRGKDDLLLRRRFAAPGGSREWFEIWSLAKSDEPATLFAHEIAVSGSNGKHLANAVHVGGREIDVSTEQAAGWDAGSYKEPVATDIEPILLPWGSVKSQTYRFDGTKFAKVHETAQAPSAAAPRTASREEARPIDPPTPEVKKGGDLGKQLLEQYKRDKGLPADTKPRFDLAVHVDGDPRPERVILMGRDLVIFGPGFRGGTQYATLTLQQFADAADIKDVTARDLTGDGGADIVVRGARHVAPAGGGETLDLDAMFVYEVKGAQITRIFAIETGREQGPKRIQGLVQFVPARGGKSFDIDVRPGAAKGWTEKTYPWPQEQPGGAIEPLLLPWGGVAGVRYVWNGTQFAAAR
jgi:hypothetical protein